jgi:hypothetical protein
MDMVYEGLQYGNETEWMSSQNSVQFTLTKEDLSDPLALAIKQKEASLAVGFHFPLYSHCPNCLQESNVYSVVEQTCN